MVKRPCLIPSKLPVFLNSYINTLIHALLMCRFPLRILNKGYDYTNICSPRFISVPCGHCPECSQHKISEFLYRCTFEYDSTIKKGGFASFLTLTFNNEHLNITTFADGSSCSTWNNRYLRLFKMRLQQYLHRLGYSLKYVCTCERGKNGSKRPHYHLILFVVPICDSCKPITASLLVRKCAVFWSESSRGNSCLDLSLRYKPFKPETRFVAKSSPFGMVYNEVISRTDHEAIKYVVKYCVKDSSDFVFNVSRIVSSSLGVSSVDMLPRTTQSNSIGISYFDSLPYVRNNSVMLGYENYVASLLLSSRPIASDGSPVNIPRYYIKKLAFMTQELCNKPVHDDSVFFDGNTYVPRFSHESPVYIRSGSMSLFYPFVLHEDYKELFLYRKRVFTKTQPNVFGVYLGLLSLGDSCVTLWNVLNSITSYNFNYAINSYEHFLSLADPSLVGLVALLQTSNIDFSPLRLMGYRLFYRLYVSYWHDTKHDSPLFRLLDSFVQLCAFSRVYNGIENSCLNAIRYNDNLINSLIRRPILFVDKLE